MYTSSLYETDFYAWTQEQSKLIKAQQWDQVDATNLIEEIETLGRKERQELRNRLGVLLGHLLKWQFQSENRSSSWLGTIREQRVQLKLLLQDSPSLKPYPTCPCKNPIGSSSRLRIVSSILQLLDSCCTTPQACQEQRI
ncbi:MAG: DUF29 domain-containing protein [Leptolyngbyaceae cyanobacterium RU_5_1]|nr:DUF29 domain-containing protein [Leptolyngbyaceae cyanobacterium RU_5_1]